MAWKQAEGLEPGKRGNKMIQGNSKEFLAWFLETQLFWVTFIDLQKYGCLILAYLGVHPTI